MEKLLIENFKAFKAEAEIKINSAKHMLVFGENGAGKSSLAEAIKLFFYSKRIFDRQISPATADPTARANEESDIIQRYRHQGNRTKKFTLEINDKKFPTDTLTGYQVNIIQRFDVLAQKEVIVYKLLTDAYIAVDDVKAFIDDDASRNLLVEWVNNMLHTYFMETGIDVDLHHNGTDYVLRIKDSHHGLHPLTTGLTSYFNEGKLHAINLLLILGSIHLNEKTAYKKITVLDDVFTSLDSSYRLALIKIICSQFGGHQLIVLTHSVSFFNQLDAAFKEFFQDKYDKIQIVEHQGESIVHAIKTVKSGSLLKKFNDNLAATGSPIDPGLANDIRRRFEHLVTEFSKVVALGGISECGALLNAVINKDSLYFRKSPSGNGQQTVHDMANSLVAEIDACTDAANPLKATLQNIVDSFRSPVAEQIRALLLDLKMYQKVTMHGGSHASTPLPPLVTREVEQTLRLMVQMETLLSSISSLDHYTY